MPRYARLDVLNTINQMGLVPVFYHADPAVVIEVAKACAAGGLRLIEFTNRGDRAFQVFTQLEEYCAAHLPEMVTGVGSIVDAATAGMYINSGANFVVGPNLNPEVARLCNRRKVAYSPGCATPTEIAQAEELGVEIVKIFPGDIVGGPQFVAALRGPCPWTSIMPTGGVDITEASLTAWFEAGITAAGIGSKLITRAMLDEKDYAGMTEQIRKTLAIIAGLKKRLAFGC
jgi:2-dehydro-3-deoxyphosphogluconate aldolase/(4S)-4-hydroxy-2-oxoglutarate aldolase